MRYQLHCQYCFRRFEALSVSEALKKVEEHEKEKCPKRENIESAALNLLPIMGK